MSIEQPDEPRRVPWFLENLAPDVTLSGVVMNAVVHGPERVREQVRTVGSFYQDYKLVYELRLDDRAVHEYTAMVEGRPVTGVGTVHLNAEGQVDEIVVNHRPLSAALTVSRLLGESAIGQRNRDEFFHPEAQTYEDLLAYADKTTRQLSC